MTIVPKRRKLFAIAILAAAVSFFITAAEPAGQIHAAGRAYDESGWKHAYERLRDGERLDNAAKADEPVHKTAYLTFDDGPSANTPKVLDILQDAHVRATFFEVGERIAAYPKFVKRAVAEGHAVGNHSYDHVYKKLYGGFDDFWEQAVKTEDAFQKAAGVRPTLLRAPGGTYTNFDAFYYYFLWQAGYEVEDWNIDSGDSKRVGVQADEIINTVKQGPLRDELVVLLHDGSGHEESVRALPAIITFLREKGYVFATLDQSSKRIQFPLGKIKWTREWSYELFARTERTVLAYAEARGIAAVQPLPAAPLMVKLGARQWTIPPGHYALKDDYFAVPLRGLAERLGGRVYWDEELETATVIRGTTVVRFDLNQRKLYHGIDGIDAVNTLAPFYLEDGELRVPIRAAVQLLGGSIAGYTVSDYAREVDVEPGTGLWWGPPHPGMFARAD